MFQVVSVRRSTTPVAWVLGFLRPETDVSTTKGPTARQVAVKGISGILYSISALAGVSRLTVLSGTKGLGYVTQEGISRRGPPYMVAAQGRKDGRLSTRFVVWGPRLL